ncbi:hypothetical protein GCM10011501_20450 [Thalassotalea profundi]|uniref:Uncharacterized protein n=1 Tax=Thalassotalea profundi TaxID=2036687 RepID=A0ABQ3IPX5_9GAMM|nr:hypothetical protein GCM10011501_20450 [Thalassotalea profundi]
MSIKLMPMKLARRSTERQDLATILPNFKKAANSKRLKITVVLKRYKINRPLNIKVKSQP